eukprot:scaffold2022_cov261-Pinguiococcus_pyrenoidosus.AAC.22
MCSMRRDFPIIPVAAEAEVQLSVSAHGGLQRCLRRLSGATRVVSAQLQRASSDAAPLCHCHSLVISCQTWRTSTFACAAGRAARANASSHSPPSIFAAYLILREAVELPGIGKRCGLRLPDDKPSLFQSREDVLGFGSRVVARCERSQRIRL